jgi:hypothetical protein
LGVKTKVTKQGRKCRAAKVYGVDLGRIYLYCDGVFVDAPVLYVKGAKVRNKKFTVDRTVVWNGKPFRVAVRGKFIGKKQKRASGTAQVTIPGACGDAGALKWRVRR